MSTSLALSAQPLKSTTVRASRRRRARLPASFVWLRRTFAWLGPRAPALSAALAERVFRTPPPYRSEAGERDALYFGDPLRVDFAGRALQAWSFGEGPTVLLVHGWGGRATQLRAFIDPLVRAGHRVVLFDGPGHGASGAGASSLPQFGAAIAAVIRAVGPVHGIVAHSMGAPATVLAMEQVGGSPHLVFIAPPAELRDVTARFGRAFAIPKDVVTRMERRIERRFLRPMEAYDLPRWAARSGSALLVIHDTLDREIPFTDGERVARSWRAPLFATTGLGHVKLLREPAVVDRAVAFVTAAPPLPAA
mgnify:CR=1 FL=1